MKTVTLTINVPEIGDSRASEALAILAMSGPLARDYARATMREGGLPERVAAATMADALGRFIGAACAGDDDDRAQLKVDAILKVIRGTADDVRKRYRAAPQGGSDGQGQDG